MLCCFLTVLSVSGQSVQITDLTTEYQKNPIGIDAAAPRLSWKLKSDVRNVMQTSYIIRVRTGSLSLLTGKLAIRCAV